MHWTHHLQELCLSVFIHLGAIDCMLNHFSRVWLLVTPGTVACQSPLSLGFPRQDYWSGLPFPSPENLPYPGIETVSPALQAVSCIAGRLYHWANRDSIYKMGISFCYLLNEASLWEFLFSKLRHCFQRGIYIDRAHWRTVLFIICHSFFKRNILVLKYSWYTMVC